jgi:CBS domain-containing protein
MNATTGSLFALTASDLMSRDVVTITEDTPLRTAAELFVRRKVGEAAVVDADGRCVGMLSAAELVQWALGATGGAPEGVPSPACRYQVMGRLLTGGDAVICTLPEGGCPLQESRALTGGRHTAVCRLRDGLVSDWQLIAGGVPASAVRRYMIADAATVAAGSPLSVLARAVTGTHVHGLIVVDGEHRPIGIVSRLDVLAALARPGSSAMGS